jgi:inhibitor of cysteine peptidase
VRRALAATLLLALVLAGTASAGRVVGVGANKNGEDVTISVGDAIVISLSAAAPSTGYAWKLAAVNRQVIRPDSTAYVPALRKTTVTGYGGVDVLIFKAIRRGNTELKLNYAKSGGKAERTFALTLRVAAPGAG